KPPSNSTIRARIASIPDHESLRKRGFVEKANNRYQARPGKFPGADYPLAVIQMDHTPADIVLVDDTFRKPIGRPWITVAIDVYSRLITGVYVSFDAPSETSVAMCLAQSIVPKDEWLALHKIDAKWPVWGVPKKVYVDNGPDFRSDTLTRSCLPYGIQL
ncbi:integrase catalytic subunit, partial [mine drainage metagenome]